MTEVSVDEILALDGEQRFDVFLNIVAEERELWVLVNEYGEFLKIYSDEHGFEYMPVWPHTDFTIEQVSDSTGKLSPMSITVPVFFSKWVTGLEKDKIQVGVFPGTGDDVCIMTASEVKSELQDAFSNFGL